MSILKVSRLGHPVLRMEAQRVSKEALNSPAMQTIRTTERRSIEGAVLIRLGGGESLLGLGGAELDVDRRAGSGWSKRQQSLE